MSASTARSPSRKSWSSIDGADHLFDGKVSEVGEAHRGSAERVPEASPPCTEAVIVAAVRTPVGKAPNGALRRTRPDDLAAAAITAALARVPGLDAAEVEDVILGCAMPEAEQGLNVARIASLRAGVPVSASAVTVNRFCASGLQAIAYAAERIMAARRQRSSPAAPSR